MLEETKRTQRVQLSGVSLSRTLQALPNETERILREMSPKNCLPSSEGQRCPMGTALKSTLLWPSLCFPLDGGLLVSPLPCSDTCCVLIGEKLFSSLGKQPRSAGKQRGFGFEGGRSGSVGKSAPSSHTNISAGCDLSNLARVAVEMLLFCKLLPA